MQNVTPTHVGAVSRRSREMPHAPSPKPMTIATANESRRTVASLVEHRCRTGVYTTIPDIGSKVLDRYACKPLKGMGRFEINRDGQI